MGSLDGKYDRSDLIELVRAAYDHGAEGYAESWPEPFPWLEDARQQLLSSQGDGASLLDLGCGPGRDSAYFCRAGLEVTAVDQSEKMIAQARQHCSECSFTQSDALDFLRNSKHEFDLIWCAFLLLHIWPDDVPEFLARCGDVLARSSGLLFLATSVSEDITHEVFSGIAGLKDRDGNEVRSPMYVWNEAALTRELLAAQFQEVSVKKFAPLQGRQTVKWGIYRYAET